MLNAISNTSPLLYLYRIDALKLLPCLFNEVLIPGAVVAELQEGRRQGYNVPNVIDYEWIRIIEPHVTPSEWLAADLGAGELATLSLAMDYTDRIVLLDDALARRTATAAGLKVWGTLKILLEAKSNGLIESIKPQLVRLEEEGMWVSEGIHRRVLELAEEK
jgi:predicted nucleic acid-binding protein